MDLQFVKDNFRMTHLNVRTEKHGDKEVPAIDIKFEADMHNSVLNKFSDGLCNALYTQDEGAVADLINPDHAPHLRSPILARVFKLPNELSYARLDIHDDNDIGHIIIKEAKARNFQIECKEGGSVHLSFSVAVCEPTPQVLTSMYLLLNENLKISLEQEESALPSNGETESTGEESAGIEDSNVHPLFNPKPANVMPSDQEEEKPTEEELAADEAARQKAMGMSVE